MICHKNLSLICFCLLKGDKKTFSLVQKIFWTNKIVSLSPFHKKPKEVTSFYDKSRHLFLWQTNKTRLLFPIFCLFSLPIVFDELFDILFNDPFLTLKKDSVIDLWLEYCVNNTCPLGIWGSSSWLDKILEKL